MKRIRTLNGKEYMDHMSEFDLYSRTPNFIQWYSNVLPYKGKRVARLLMDYKGPSSKLLDLGCSIGLTLSVVGQYFPNYIGCDIYEEKITATNKLLERLKMKKNTVLYNGSKLPFKDNTFDIVTSIEVTEHSKNPQRMIKEIQRVLKKDGIVQITTPNKWWPIDTHFKLPFISYIPNFLADYYVRLTGRGTSYEGIKHFGYEDFHKMVDKYFVVEDKTMDLIVFRDKYFLAKERGWMVALLSDCLKFLRKLGTKNDSFRKIDEMSESILTRFSLGWVFIGRPRK